MNKSSYLFKRFLSVIVIALVFTFLVSDLYNARALTKDVARQAVLDPSSLTADSFTITNTYSAEQNLGHYTFTLGLKEGNTLDEAYELSIFWTFDEDTFKSSEVFTMTTDSDPTKSHSLSVVINVINKSDGTNVKAVELPLSYYKDGKVLANYEPATTEPQKTGFLKMFYLPIIALILLIIYLIYFKKQSYTGGLDVTIDRLRGIVNMDGLIADVVNSDKLTEKKKLGKIRLLYKTVKLDLTNTLNMLKTYTLSASVNIDTKSAVEKINGAVEFLDKDYKKMSIEELTTTLDQLFKEHLTPAITICRMIVETNNKYLKKVHNEQI